jgi:hypothetical protein
LSPGGVDSQGPQSGAGGWNFSGGGFKNPRDWIPSLVSALAALFLLRTGFLGIFFLVPLGFTASFFGGKTLWRAVLLAVFFNLCFALGAALLLGRPFVEFIPDLGFFFLMTAVFAWLMAPPAAGPRFFRVRAAYRLVLGALAGALAGIAFITGDSTGFGGMVYSQAELIASLAADAAGGDAVRRSLLEQELNPQRIASFFNTVLLRGGALASSMAVLFISRQFSLVFAGIAGRRSGARERRGGSSVNSLRDFHAPRFLIWAFSGSLAGILLLRIAGFSAAETVVWNLLTVCVLMYLAQGFGIVQFFLSRRELPVPLRLLLNVGIVLAILSPGINMAVLILLVLLGAAEYWVPLRRVSGEPPHNGPPSTPAA